MSQCVLLNADYSFLNIVDWKRALCLVVKNKVQVLSYSERVVNGAEGYVLRVPAVMKLVKLIRALYRTRVPFSKRNILIRDNFRCVYCGRQEKKLTIDHIVPRSQGGRSNFENCVACCRGCNAKKGCRTPSEVGMFMKRRPYQPTIAEFLRIKLSRLGFDNLWEQIGKGY
jgi:5-methylcytosine-specific restriction endonuclease McrA